LMRISLYFCATSCNSCFFSSLPEGRLECSMDRPQLNAAARLQPSNDFECKGALNKISPLFSCSRNIQCSITA
jgi:hypothetical protein